MPADEVEQTLRLALAIHGFDPEEAKAESRQTGERPECVCCGGAYIIEIGDDPTPTCHACAHALLAVFVEAMLKSTREALARLSEAT